VNPALGQDEYLAKLMSAHMRERLAYTMEFASELARLKGYSQPSPDDVAVIMERLWHAYVPTSPQHAGPNPSVGAGGRQEGVGLGISSGRD
jgi:hypothetical protein